MRTTSLDDPHETVKLGRHIYEVVPQPLPLLKRNLGRMFEEITSMGDVDAQNIGAVITGRAWDILKVFLPDLMPLHEWEGYASQAQMEADDPDEDIMRSAQTGPQVKTAIALCMKANGLDVWKTLGKLVDPTLLRAKVTAMLAESLSTSSPRGSSPRAPTPSTTSSPPESPTVAITGPSEPTGSGSATTTPSTEHPSAAEDPPQANAA